MATMIALAVVLGGIGVGVGLGLGGESSVSVGTLPPPPPGGSGTPPPPSPAPPGAVQVVQALISTSVIASGAVEDYTAEKRDAVAGVVASAAGVPASAVTVTVTSASVRLSIDIALEDTTAAEATAARLAAPDGGDGIFASADALATALETGGVAGVTIAAIEAAPAVQEVLVFLPYPPAPPPVAASPESASSPRSPPPHPPPPHPPSYVYPAALQPGPAALPLSASGVLITLSKVVGSGAARPVARTYDGHGWEELSASPLPPASALDPTTFSVDAGYDRASASSQFGACTPAGSHCEVVLPNITAGCVGDCYYRLDRYEVEAAAGDATKRAASRFLLQSTFGPTRALLDGPLGSDMSLASVRAWIGEQTNLPPTILRSYVRKRTNPRIRMDLEGQLMGRTRPACSKGSRWHRFAFNSEDEDRIVRISSTASGTLELRAEDGELRSELALPNYVRRLALKPRRRSMLRALPIPNPEQPDFESQPHQTITTAGRCGVFQEYITSLTECLAAARSFGVQTRRYSDEARDDGKSIGDTSRPRGCYFLGSLGPPERMSTSYLYVNVNDGNVRACSETKVCFCKRALNVSTAPPPPTPPPAPPALPGVSDPTLCQPWPSQCCVVLYHGVQGAQCTPVPIWDFANWEHPGPKHVTAEALCGRVIYDWCGKNPNHCNGDATSTTVARRPEDLTSPDGDLTTHLLGSLGLSESDHRYAARVGMYVEPSCSSPPPPPNATAAPEVEDQAVLEFRICSVEESVGGLIKMVPHNPNQELNDNQNPCSSGFLNQYGDWYALYNPPIEFSAQDPSIYQTYSSSEVQFSPLGFGNGPSDAYLLDQMPPECTLSAQSPAYMQVGATWYRHDRRLEFTNCTAACQQRGRVGHPYTLTSQSFSGVDRTSSELANEPALGHRLNMWLIDEAGFKTFMPFAHSRDDAKMMAWTSVTLGCADQLRHRIAFALSQILVIGEDGINKQEQYEP